jgi:hypothetical protein
MEGTPRMNKPSADATRPEAPSSTTSRGPGRRMLGWLEDAGLVLLIPFALGLAILIVGAPLALIVWLVEIGRRWL